MWQLLRNLIPMKHAQGERGEEKKRRLAKEGSCFGLSKTCGKEESEEKCFHTCDWVVKSCLDVHKL
jgi:hypothetical protein